VQILEEVPPDVLFVDNYLYFSSFSDHLLAHAREHALGLVEQRGLGPDSLVVEIASNDGYLLRNFVEHGIPVIGIDPAPDQAAAATAAGIPTMAEFFGVDLAERIRSADPRLRRIALFDAVVNNADRKAGHLLPRPDGTIQGVDHGVTFSTEPKLRTVLWGWRGTRFAPREERKLALLKRALPRLRATLEPYLAVEELDALSERIELLVRTGRFPEPHPDWPAVPWPWY